MDGQIGVRGSLALALVVKVLHLETDIAKVVTLDMIVSVALLTQFSQRNVKWADVQKCPAGVSGLNVLSLAVVPVNELDPRLV